MTDGRPDIAKRIRHAAIVGGLGLVVQLVAAFRWTPATFILSTSIGVPLVLLGGALFLRAVWKNMRDKGAL